MLRTNYLYSTKVFWSSLRSQLYQEHRQSGIASQQTTKPSSVSHNRFSQH